MVAIVYFTQKMERKMDLKFYTVTIRATECDIAVDYQVIARSPQKAENLVRYKYHQHDAKEFGPIKKLTVSRGKKVQERVLGHD